jgi:hypothetical protein
MIFNFIMMDRNLRIGKLWYEKMWNEPSFELAQELVHPEYDPTWIFIPKSGPAQVIHEIKYFRSVFPDLFYQVIDIVATDSEVWIRYKGKGTQKGNAWGFEPTNKSVEFEGITILYVNSDGKIIDRWGSFCFYDILNNLDLVPKLWELNDLIKKK